MSELLVSVDPGLRELGLARFEGERLVCAELVRNPVRRDRGPAAWAAMAGAVGKVLQARPDVLVLELPQVYLGSRAPGVDPADLLELTGVLGAIVGSVGAKRALGYRPREWKGQVPKRVHQERLMGILTAGELAAIRPCPDSLIHNVRDAIGLGLFQLKRTTGMGYAR